MKNHIFIIMGLSIAAGVGCGSKDTTEKVSNQNPDTQTVSSNQEPATSKNVFKVALDARYEPFEYKDENGNIIGYDIDLIEAIADQEEFEIEIIEDDFIKLLPAIESEKYDIVISAMKLNDSRKQKFLASDAYFKTHEGFVVKKESSLKSIADIEGQTVAVLNDSHQHEKLQFSSDTNIVTEPTIFLAFKSIFVDKADAVYSEEPILHFEAKRFPENPVRFIPSEAPNNSYVIYTSKDNKELMLKINSGLQTLKQNGKYHELTKKWFGEYASNVEIL